MCGICGVVSVKGLAASDYAAVRRMAATMVHRGPDDYGEYASGNIMIAMRRLSIIDVEGGHQPLSSEDGAVILIANGEIYNHVELRERLIGLGHVFRTRSDCETIIHAYEQYGLNFVTLLRGMFALALFDRRHGRLVLVRDRMGEKPLYLWEQNGVLVFASELRALLASLYMPFELDAASIGCYFALQYVPQPRCAVTNVRKLAPGTMLVVNTTTGQSVQHCYWQMEDAAPMEGRPGPLLSKELDEIGRLIIRSDVPVGVALSGGLDSSIVAALAKKHSSQQVRAFTVGYDGRPECDERSAARELADHLEMPSMEVEICSADVVRDFTSLNFMRDEPIADISGYGYYRVMKEASDKGVSVMLQGQGGDELFWGYPWVAAAAAETDRKMQLFTRPAEAAVTYLRISKPEVESLWHFRHWVFSGGGLGSELSCLFRDLKSRHDSAVFYELAPDYLEAWRKLEGWNQALSVLATHVLDQTFGLRKESARVELTRLICDVYLLGNGIPQADRLGMAASVEPRLPLLDYRFVETVVGLRKMGVAENLSDPKSWLKDSVQDLLPEWVLLRPKRGFTPPLRDWYACLFREYGEQLREGELLQRGLLPRDVLRVLSLGKDITRGVAPFSFKALILENWCRSITDMIKDIKGRVQERVSLAP